MKLGLLPICYESFFLIPSYPFTPHLLTNTLGLITYFLFLPQSSSSSSPSLSLLRCTSFEDCAGRANTSLGSSKFWTSTIPAQGITSGNATFNPYFASWSVAYLYYCDGVSFSGNRSEPVTQGNTTLYFRGYAILHAVLDDLFNRRSLSKARRVLLSGHSAGGLATYMHADAVGQRLSKYDIDFRAAPDAGFFLDIPDLHGSRVYRQNMQTVLNLSSFVGDADCMAHYSAPGEGWQCGFAQYTFPFITTQLHMIQSTYDTFQLPNILGLSCFPPLKSNCSQADLAAFQNFHSTMLNVMTEVGVFNRTGLGMWCDSCTAHSQAYYGDYYNNTHWEVSSGSGNTLVASIAAWMEGQSARIEIDRCDYPCNSGCAKYHGDV